MKAGRPMRVAFNAPPERRACSAQGEASDADMALREIVGKLVETANGSIPLTNPTPRRVDVHVSI